MRNLRAVFPAAQEREGRERRPSDKKSQNFLFGRLQSKKKAVDKQQGEEIRRTTATGLRERTEAASNHSPVVHHEEVKVGNVVNDKLEETVGEEMAGLLVGPVADAGVGGETLELPALAAINTTGLPPRLLLTWR